LRVVPQPLRETGAQPYQATNTRLLGSRILTNLPSKAYAPRSVVRSVLPGDGQCRRSRVNFRLISRPRVPARDRCPRNPTRSFFPAPALESDCTAGSSAPCANGPPWWVMVPSVAGLPHSSRRWVEHRFPKPGVGGSIPPGASGRNRGVNGSRPGLHDLSFVAASYRRYQPDSPLDSLADRLLHQVALRAQGGGGFGTRWLLEGRRAEPRRPWVLRGGLIRNGC
jgi:hypothetical protein